MQYHIMHKTEAHTLLAICSSEESAKRWIERFDPRIWTDKTMTKADLIIVPKAQ